MKICRQMSVRMSAAAARMLVILLALVLCLPVCTWSAQALDVSAPTLFLNGRALSFSENDGEPYCDDTGTLWAPVRALAAACGYSVAWDAKTKTASIPFGEGEMTLTIGSQKLLTWASSANLGASAYIGADGRTYVPATPLLEALGFTVTSGSQGSADIYYIDGTLGAASPEGLSAVAVDTAAANAVFYIEAYQDGELSRTGSGFLIDPSGIAVTNYHVITGTTGFVITLIDGQQYAVSSLLYGDETKDIALFQVSLTSESGTVRSVFPYLQLGDSSLLQNGETVYAIGSPLGLQNSISNGIISNSSRVYDDGVTFIQNTAAISFGSSGGPLLNDRAEVIGITTAYYTYGQSLYLATPIQAVKDVLSTLGTAA